MPFNDVVWSVILKQLYETDYTSLASISAVSHQLYYLAIPLLYRKVTISEHRDAGASRALSLLTRLCKENSHLPPLIRHIVVSPTLLIATPSIVELTTKLMSRLTCLETFTWNGNAHIPDSVLQAFHATAPQAKMHITRKQSPYQVEGSYDEGFTRFPTPQLESLECEISQGGERNKRSLYFEHKILKTSPNLRKLKVHVQRGGCVVYVYRRLPDLDPQPDDKLPQLEELSYPNFSRGDLMTWKNLGGCSKLQMLKLDNLDQLSCFAGSVPNLRYLTIEANIQDFVFGFPDMGPLEQLDLTGPNIRIPLEVLPTYGDTLTGFFIHSPEPYAPKKRQSIEISELETLRAICPNLKRLGIDVNRDGDWNPTFLRELCKFQQVEELTLGFEGMRGTEIPVKPEINKESSRDLFNFIREQKAGQQLSRLMVNRGGMSSIFYGYPSPRALAERDYKSQFSCWSNAQGETFVQQLGRQDGDARYYSYQSSYDADFDHFYGCSEGELKALINLLDFSGDEKCRNTSDESNDFGIYGQEIVMAKLSPARGILALGFLKYDKDKRKRERASMVESLERKLRKRRLEEAFKDDDTLYDIMKEGTRRRHD